jgi:hypothetical protein
MISLKHFIDPSLTLDKNIRLAQAFNYDLKGIIQNDRYSVLTFLDPQKEKYEIELHQQLCFQEIIEVCRKYVATEN